ncbi:VanZ family protein [Streptomyces sp. NPDC088910]|uniref:VanZ family protein n=1 Tax=Streptomyces sp. NPDC088910 TaxID=3365911 RepID=UPI00380A558D
MAVRMALFRTAPKEPKDGPKAKAPKATADPATTAKSAAKPARTPVRKAAQPRTSAQARTRQKAPAKAPAKTAATARTTARDTAPARTWPWTKAAPPAAEAGPKATPQPEPRPTLKSRFGPKPKAAPVVEPEPVEEPYVPLLQRRSWGATLARVVVLAAAIVGMVAFAVALAKVTLVPSPASVSLIHSNLHPGHSIRAYLNGPSTRDAVKQIGGNILLGVPFGILLPMLFPKARGLLRVGVLTGLVMLTVETTQGVIIVGRSFDIDDVILNTAGALIGYLLLGLRLGRALYPRRHHWWQRRRPDSGPRQDGRRDVRGGLRQEGIARQEGTARPEGTVRARVRPGRRPAPKRP